MIAELVVEFALLLGEPIAWAVLMVGRFMFRTLIRGTRRRREQGWHVPVHVVDRLPVHEEEPPLANSSAPVPAPVPVDTGRLRRSHPAGDGMP